MSYFTAIFPYIVISILLVKGLTMDGAGRGIMFYLKPNVTKLADPKVQFDLNSFTRHFINLLNVTIQDSKDYKKITNQDM